MGAGLSSAARADTTQAPVDTAGECDAFGAEVPFASRPAYHSLARADAAVPDQDRARGCCTVTSFEWRHVCALPAGETWVAATPQIDGSGVQDADGAHRDKNRLSLDGVEPIGARDSVNAAPTAQADALSASGGALADGSLLRAGDRGRRGRGPLALGRHVRRRHLHGGRLRR